MTEILQFSSMLCTAAVGCCLLRMLVPDNALTGTLKIILSAFFLLCLFGPLQGLALPDISLSNSFFPEQQEQQERLTGTLNEQIAQSAKKNIEALINAKLEKLGIFGTKLFININTDEQNSIDITDIEVLLPKEHAGAAKTVEAYIAGELQLPCQIVLDKGEHK